MQFIFLPTQFVRGTAEKYVGLSVLHRVLVENSAAIYLANKLIPTSRILDFASIFEVDKTSYKLTMSEGWMDGRMDDECSDG